MLRIFIAFLFAVIISYANLFAVEFYEPSNHYSVGMTPIKVFKLNNSNKIHIFCAGVDNNYNDILDAEDEAPSWWTIDSITNIPRKIMDFDVFFKYRPFRPDVDQFNGILYIPMVGKIISIKLNEERIEDELVAEIDAHSVRYLGGHLLITVSPGIDEIGRIDILNLENKTIIQSIDGGKNILDCISYVTQSGVGIAILNNGEYSAGNGSVLLGSINMNNEIKIEDTIEVGNTPNHIIYNKNKLYIASNHSHSIHLIDLIDNEVKVWYTGTSGWNGPRELTVHDEKLFITTYSGDVREIDINTGLLVNINNSYYGHKIENLAFIDDDRFMATSSYDEDYLPLDEVQYWTKVEESFDFIKEVNVGKSPVGLIKYPAGDLHVFCMGDEPSNEQPSWWTITKNGQVFTAQKRYEFEFGDIKLPFRPAVNHEKRTMYIAGNQMIKSFNIDTYSSVENMAVLYDPVALSIAGNNLLVAANYLDKADSIAVINLQSGSEIHKIYAGLNVQDVKYYPLNTLESEEPVMSMSILTNDDEQNSRLILGPISPNGDFTVENEIEVGNGAVGIFASDENILCVASYNSGDVFVINVGNNVVESLKLGTPIPYGPTSITGIDDIGIFVGTAAGDLRPISLFINNSIDDMKLYLSNFIPIGLPITDNVIELNKQDLFIAVTGPKKIDSELPENIVYIINDETSSVREYKKGDIASVKLYPNPANEFINIEAELRDNLSSTMTVEIISITGVKIASLNVPSAMNFSHTFNIKELGISAGQYILNIINGSDVKSVPFNIVR